MSNFNFYSPPKSGLNFNFGDPPYNNFNFTESGYVPDSYDFSFGPDRVIYRIIAGISNNFTTIWADSDAGLNNTKMYISSVAAFSIVDLENKKLIDYYTVSHVGACGESLEQEDIVDINVTM